MECWTLPQSVATAGPVKIEIGEKLGASTEHRRNGIWDDTPGVRGATLERVYIRGGRGRTGPPGVYGLLVPTFVLLLFALAATRVR